MRRFKAMLSELFLRPSVARSGIVRVGRLPTRKRTVSAASRRHLAVGGFDAVCQLAPESVGSGGGDSY